MLSNIAAHRANADANGSDAKTTKNPSMSFKAISSSSKRKNPSSYLMKNKKRQPLTTRKFDLYRLNYTVPENYVPVMNDEITKLVSLGDECWLPFAERLRGWTKEIRIRGNGILDNFYYHGNKKFRTFKEVKKYIYLGYRPSKENGDEPLERLALDQPDPQEMKIKEPATSSAALKINSQKGSSTRPRVGAHSISGYFKK